jgi:hypothetical protein
MQSRGLGVVPHRHGRAEARRHDGRGVGQHICCALGAGRGQAHDERTNDTRTVAHRRADVLHACERSGQDRDAALHHAVGAGGRRGP